MSFPKEKPFNPKVTSVPVFGPSSGNPQALQDPNSVASIGLKIQAATDQANADTLYDVTPGNEGFRNEVYSPWIMGTEACKKEGFKMRFPKGKGKFSPMHNVRGYGGLVILAFLALYFTFRKRY